MFPVLKAIVATGSAMALAGCVGARSTATEVRVEAPAVASDVGAETFEDTCVVCHDGSDPDRPDFSASLTPIQATKAIRAISLRNMPPRGKVSNRLSEDERLHLTQWLCQRTGRSDKGCDELLRAEFRGGLSVSGPTAKNLIARATSRTSPTIERLPSVAKPADSENILSFSALVLLSSLDACSSGGEKGGKPKEIQPDCVGALLQEILRAPKKGN